MARGIRQQPLPGAIKALNPRGNAIAAASIAKESIYRERSFICIFMKPCKKTQRMRRCTRATEQQQPVRRTRQFRDLPLQIT
jgi:hypothetical protein